MLRATIFLLLLASCAPEPPEPPEGYSERFKCTYSGFTVLKGWLTVDQDLEDVADSLDLSLGLDCESEEYAKLSCYLELD